MPGKIVSVKYETDDGTIYTIPVDEDDLYHEDGNIMITIDWQKVALQLIRTIQTPPEYNENN